jgi:hypothetical protein
VSTFYGADAWGTQVADIRTMFEAIKDRLPNNVTITYPPSGDILSETTGIISGTWSATPPANTVGTGATVYAAPVGVIVHWLTSTIVAGRRLRGKTFFVPVIAQETASGVPDAPLVADFQAAAGVLAAISPGLVVWHRPNNPPALNNGSLGAVTGALVPTKFMVLRSRRD